MSSPASRRAKSLEVSSSEKGCGNSGPSDRQTGFHIDRKDWLAIVLIVVLAAIPRLLMAVSLPPLLHLDSDSYFEIAQRLWGGHGLGDLSRRTPLYPLVISIAGHSSRLGLFPVVLLQHLLGVADAVLLYVIARRLFSPRYHIVAAASG